MKPRNLFVALFSVVLVFTLQGSAFAYPNFGSCADCHTFEQDKPAGNAWHELHFPQTCIQQDCTYCHSQNPALQRSTCSECHHEPGTPSHHECAGGPTSCVGCHGSNPPGEDTDLSDCLDECGDSLDNDGDCLYDGDDSDCGTATFALTLSASYAAGSLNLDFTLGTPEAATWSNYLILISPAVQVIPLWSVPLPALDPPLHLPISFPFPALGTIGIYSGLFTAAGPQAFELAWVNTG